MTDRPDPRAIGRTRRSHVLRTAERLVNHDRNETYDEPSIDLARIAALWSAFFGIEIKPHEVALAMGLLKVGRAKSNPSHADNYADMIGWGTCAYDTSPAYLESETE